MKLYKIGVERNGRKCETHYYANGTEIQISNFIGKNQPLKMEGKRLLKILLEDGNLQSVEGWATI
ncbi:MAG: hypothetical protein ABIG37_00515 [Nanoarchaeota archaeon]|nr:hypothetical protein [Nanoarchaeota archaeon]